MWKLWLLVQLFLVSQQFLSVTCETITFSPERVRGLRDWYNERRSSEEFVSKLLSNIPIFLAFHQWKTRLAGSSSLSLTWRISIDRRKMTISASSLSTLRVKTWTWSRHLERAVCQGVWMERTQPCSTTHFRGLPLSSKRILLSVHSFTFLLSVCFAFALRPLPG